MVAGADERQPSAIQASNETRNCDRRRKAGRGCSAGNSEQHFEAGRFEMSRTDGAMRYVVIVEEGENSFGAYVPDLPGCVAAAETKDEVLELIREAIEFHIEGLREDGQPVPEPSSSSEYVEVRAA